MSWFWGNIVTPLILICPCNLIVTHGIWWKSLCAGSKQRQSACSPVLHPSTSMFPREENSFGLAPQWEDRWGTVVTIVTSEICRTRSHWGVEVCQLVNMEGERNIQYNDVRAVICYEQRLRMPGPIFASNANGSLACCHLERGGDKQNHNFRVPWKEQERLLSEWGSHQSARQRSTATVAWSWTQDQFLLSAEAESVKYL